MPNRDGTGPTGKGPKKVNQGIPKPNRDGTGNGNRRRNTTRRNTTTKP